MQSDQRIPCDALTALGGVFPRGWLNEAELNEIVGMIVIIVPTA